MCPEKQKKVEIFIQVTILPINNQDCRVKVRIRHIFEYKESELESLKIWRLRFQLFVGVFQSYLILNL